MAGPTACLASVLLGELHACRSAVPPSSPQPLRVPPRACARRVAKPIEAARKRAIVRWLTTLGARSIAVLATSSIVALATPCAWAVGRFPGPEPGRSHRTRPAAAHLSSSSHIGWGNADHATSEMDTPDELVVSLGQLESAPEIVPIRETPAVVRARRCAGDVACFLVCTRAYESDTGDANGQGTFDAGYGAVSSDGSFRGAYQFLRSTWDSTAIAMGRTDLVGLDPAAVDPHDQDLVAAALYGWAGNSPWGGRC